MFSIFKKSVSLPAPWTPVDIAKLFGFVREEGQNHGKIVEAIQHWGGGIPGQSWCAYFIIVVLDLFFGGPAKNPVLRSGEVNQIYNQAKKMGWLVSTPQIGDLFIYVDDNDHAYHIGFVSGNSGGISGIAGNTSPDGKSPNGTGVFEHGLISNSTHLKFIHYPR